MISKLVEVGASVNGSEDYAPVVEAARLGLHGSVKTLLHHKADVNKPDTIHGTALASAVLSGNYEMANLLLGYGAFRSRMSHPQISTDDLELRLDELLCQAANN